MQDDTHDFWWLVALEASLSFSLICWESVACLAAPLTHPLNFTVAVVVVATLAMAVYHLGPALFAAKFGAHRHWFANGLSVSMAAFYLQWCLGFAILVRHEAAVVGWPFVLCILIAGLVKSWWKAGGLAGLVFGLAVLGWAFATSWPGHAARNPYRGGLNEQFGGSMAGAILLTAVPAVLVAWRIGRTKPSPARLWLSGLLGVWLPLVISVTLASIAAESGVNAHYRPSLGRSFSWGLLGAEGKLEPRVITLALMTIGTPALLGLVSLRWMLKSWDKRIWLAAAPLCGLVAWVEASYRPADGLYSALVAPVMQLWAAILAMIGLLAGLIAVIGRHGGRIIGKQ